MGQLINEYTVNLFREVAIYHCIVSCCILPQGLEQILCKLLKMQVNLKLYNYTGIPFDFLAIQISCDIQNKIYLQHVSRSIIAVYLSGILAAVYSDVLHTYRSNASCNSNYIKLSFYTRDLLIISVFAKYSFICCIRRANNTMGKLLMILFH